MIVVCAKMPLKTSKERAKIPRRSTPIIVVKFFIVVDLGIKYIVKCLKNKKTTLHAQFSTNRNENKAYLC
jgi:hypothetical protein